MPGPGVNAGAEKLSWTPQQLTLIENLRKERGGKDGKVDKNELTNLLNGSLKDKFTDAQKTYLLSGGYESDFIDKAFDAGYKLLHNETLDGFDKTMGKVVDGIRGFFGFKPVYGNK